MMTLFKKSVKKLGATPTSLKTLGDSLKSTVASEMGVFGDKIAEAVPNFLSTASDHNL